MSFLRQSSQDVPTDVVAQEPDMLSLSQSGDHPVASFSSQTYEEQEAAAEWTPPKTLFSTMWNMTAWYTERPFLGRRQGADYQYLTYADAWTMASHLGAGLIHLEALQVGQHYCICSINTPEWAVADFAAALYSFVTVPLVVTLDDETLIYCLNLAEIRTAIVSQEKREQFVRVAAQVPLLKTLVVMDAPAGFVERTDRGLRELSMSFVQSQGEANFTPYPDDDPEALWSLVYTSGSTGMPKAAVMTRDRWNKFVTAGYLMPKDTVCISFAPLAHVSERQTLYIVGFYGGRICSYGGDMNNIFDDIQLCKPTYISAPPRIYNQIYAEYKGAVDKLVQQRGQSEKWKIELEMLEPFRKLLGGRIEYLVTGSAPTSDAVKQFLERCYQVTVYDGYGSTEAGGIATDNIISPDVDVKLLDVPELGYFTTDKPYPRGEICVKTKHMISGYWKNEEKTKEAFTEDGYFRTGDVGVVRHTGEVAIIDRVKNIFKLAQGEFVAPARVEMVMLKSKLIDQICVCGNPLASSVCAVVVPNPSVLLAALEEPESQTLTALLADEKKHELAERLILADFGRLAQRQGLQGFEIPSRLVLMDERMTAENGLLTPSMKLKRAPIHKRFAKELDALWDNPLPSTGTGASPSIMQMLSQVLSVPEATLDSTSSFLSQGGDSLSAVRLAQKIRATFEQDVPLSVILANPSVAQLEQYLAGDRSAAPQLPQAAIADLTTLNTDCLGPAVESTPPFGQGRHFLLTGATGFLGAFTLRAMLHRYREATISCIVRGEHGKQRLLETLAKRDIIVSEADRERILVLRGDLADGLLGQSMKEYNRLCREVDAVVHAAATVNWMLSYESLRATNVAVVLDLVRLCSTHSVKPLLHVSTRSCAPSRKVAGSNAYEEYEAFVRDDAWATMMGPYGISKYVAEHLLLKAAPVGTVPWVCVRPAFISADRSTGCGNLTDFVHRYLHDCVRLGAYIDLPDAIRNLTPVDFVVDVMLAVAEAPESSCKPHHATNNRSPTWSQFGQALVEQGFKVKPVSYEEFRGMLLHQEDPDALHLFGLLPMFTESPDWLYERNSDISNALAAGAKECPALESQDYATWMSYLTKIQFLQK